MGCARVIAVVAVVLVASIAAAKPAAKAKKPAGAPMSAQVEKAVKLYTDGDFAGALAELESAQQSDDSPELLFHLGVCLKGLKRYGAAVKSFEAYLQRGGAKVSKERRAAVTKEIAQVKDVAAVVILNVPGEPADLSIDGESAGRSPLEAPLLLEPGRRKFTAKRDGQIAEKTEELVGGAQVTIVLTPGQGPPPGDVTFESAQGPASVSVDGKPVGTTPVTVPLEPGSHTVTADLPGYASFWSRMTVLEGTKQKFALTFDREQAEAASSSRRRFPIVGIAVAAAGLAALGGSIALSISASAQSREVQALFASGGQWDAYYDQRQAVGERTETWSVVLGVVGAAALTTGLIMTLVNLLFSDDDGGGQQEESAPAEQTSLLVAPVRGGLFTGLSFRW